jgi:hypothetical protein
VFRSQTVAMFHADHLKKLDALGDETLAGEDKNRGQHGHKLTTARVMEESVGYLRISAALNRVRVDHQTDGHSDVGVT